MRVTQRTFLAFQLNGAACCGRYDDVTIHQVKRHIEDGTILNFLRQRLGHDFDPGIMSPLDRTELLMEWNDLLCISESRKFAVEQNGLCLLVAYLLEGIQRRLCEARDRGLWREDEMEIELDEDAAERSEDWQR